MDAPPQESRTERATVSLTPREKEGLRLVATVHQTTESELLRTRYFPEVMEEAERLWAKLRDEVGRGKDGAADVGGVAQPLARTA